MAREPLNSSQRGDNPEGGGPDTGTADGAIGPAGEERFLRNEKARRLRPAADRPRLLRLFGLRGVARTVLLSIALLTSPLLVATAPAAPLPEGGNAPELRAALSQWLRGDEALALPAMAALAADGNEAAQLLLGVINVTPDLQGPWLDTLGRAERIALLRRPDAGQSLSGKSWFSQPGDPRAVVWDRALQADAPLTVILDFARLEEPRAAAQAAFRLMSRQRRGFAALADDPAFPAALLPYAALELGRPEPLAPDDPHRALFGPPGAGMTPDLEAQSRWMADHADAVVAVCAATCPTDPAPVCRAAALAALGGPMGLLHTGSPVEVLVPSSTFNRSPKGLQMTLALMTPANLAASPVASQCLTDALK